MVFIGLLVAGILVGVTIINAASVRATVAQYEKYTAAVNTFVNKYGGLPGDLKNGISKGAVYDNRLCPAAGCTSGAQGLGDGNGVIEHSILVDPSFSEGEPLLFWQQLSVANLVDGYYGSDLTTSATPNAGLNQAMLSRYVPPSKLGRSTYWKVHSNSGQNYYMLSGIGAGLTFERVITPEEAYTIDSKIDDGRPNIGNVQARGTGIDISDAYGPITATTAATWSTATPSSVAVGDCITTGSTATDTTNTYVRNGLPGNSPACILRLRLD